MSAVPFSENATEPLPARSASAPCRKVTDQAPWTAGENESWTLADPVTADSGHTAHETLPPTRLNKPSPQALTPRYKIASELETTRLASSPAPSVRFGETLPVNTGGV